MQTRTFGPNALINDRAAFGTMQFGGRADAAQSEAMYRACRDAGIVMFDTAHDYTGGASETLLGQFIANEREQIILVTKVAAKGGSGRDNIKSQFNESLRRLNQDYVDVLFLHRWDPNTPLEETLEACEELRAAGQIHHLGVSNFSAWQTMKARAVAEREGFQPLDILQPMYNLVKRQVEVEILPMALSEDMAVIGYSPLGGGLLTGKYAAASASGRLVEDQMYEKRYGSKWMHDAAIELSAIAARQGVHPATLAVAWAGLHAGITAPIISAKTVEQLQPSLAALTFDMPQAVKSELDGLVSAPPPATDRLEELSTP